MQRIILAMLLAVSCLSIAKAQEFTGESAEKIKGEVIKIEQEKVSMMMKGGPAAADWFDRFETDGMVWISVSDGMSFKGQRTKSEMVAEWRSGARKMFNVKHYDFHVHLYENGNTAAMTYRASGTIQYPGKPPIEYHELAMEVVVKQDGMWRAVAHSRMDVPAQ